MRLSNLIARRSKIGLYKKKSRIRFTRNANNWISDRIENREPLWYKSFKSDIAQTKKEKTKAYRDNMTKRYKQIKKYW